MLCISCSFSKHLYCSTQTLLHPNTRPPSPIPHNFARGRNAVLPDTDGRAGYFEDSVKRDGGKAISFTPATKTRTTYAIIFSIASTIDESLRWMRTRSAGLSLPWNERGEVRGAKQLQARRRTGGWGPTTIKRTTPAVKPRPKAKPTPSH